MSDHSPAKKDAKLADGWCARCERTVMAVAVEYPHGHPEHYDGVSEYRCLRCGRREGRWTGTLLTGGASEPRLGRAETHDVIKACEARKPLFSQPR